MLKSFKRVCMIYMRFWVINREEGDEEEENKTKNACKALYERIPLHHNIRSMKQKFYFSCEFKGLREVKRKKY